MKRPFLLKSRDGYWHFRLANETSFHTTGIKNSGARSRGAAERFAARKWEESGHTEKLTGATLRDYAAPFYLPETDPRARRRRDEGRRVGLEHLAKSRAWIDAYVLTDPIASKRMTEIRRADLLDFRHRLVKRCGDHRNTANKVMAAVKTIFREAVYRQDIPADPTMGIGTIKEERIEPGVFTEDELRKMFPKDGVGPWMDQRGYTCFLIAATTGLRRGEIMALRWGDLDLEAETVSVKRAWKRFEKGYGPPKSGKPRMAPLPAVTVRALRALQEEVIRHHPDDLVLCYDDGVRLGGTWWQRRFTRAMGELGLDWRRRNLRPHSLRHSLTTLLVAADYDREKLRAALGWSGDQMRAHYTHLQPEHLRGQAEIVDRILG